MPFQSSASQIIFDFKDILLAMMTPYKPESIAIISKMTA